MVGMTFKSKKRVWWLTGKESSCQCRRYKRWGFDPWVGKIPTRVGNGNPLQDSCLENSIDRGAWWATVYGVAKSQTWLSRVHTRPWLQCLSLSHAHTHTPLTPGSLSLSHTHTHPPPWLQCPKPYSALLNLSISSIGQAACFLQLPAWFSALVHGMNMKYTKQKVRMKYFFSTLLRGNLVVFLKKRFIFNYKHTLIHR